MTFELIFLMSILENTEMMEKNLTGSVNLDTAGDLRIQ